ncbi:hypothetical protein OPT61_g3292 [Boeremia exigua]|uniref:Uncharacterized protein n=1 Tax=Boeremia exigua TaxID=749465 RepID=A0ACC2IIG7_9PLEO|nr:hypothetical protein OPT61_g3292 [Boeremia exigua]
MKATQLCAYFALAPTVLAQGLRQATGGVEPTTIIQQYPTPTPEVSNCTASLITTLCDYKKPLPGTAVASTGKASCWEYCNAHQPCNFVIFVAGNPYTGSGTCWVYPDEKFDETLGEPGCDHLSVYDKPQCAEPTPTAGACAATASPSAVATICDYPTPDDDCWSTCTASSGATDCLSQCAQSDSCNYVVFNPRNEMNSQFYSGTCWKYPNGTYDASKAGTCSGVTEQFVYENPCPKPSPTSSPSSASAPSGGSSPSATGSGAADVNAEQASENTATSSVKANSVAHRGFEAGGSVLVGVAALMWQGLR